MYRAELFKKLFKGRQDVYGVVGGGCIKEPLTDQILLSHINGEKHLGKYPLLKDNTSYWIAIDFDNWNVEKVLEVQRNLEHYEIPAHLEISKSKGYHIWIFFDSPITARKSRLVTKHIVEETSEGKVYELFPKQDILPKDGYGNYINLPLFGGLVKNGKTVFINNEGKPYEDQWSYIRQINSISENRIDEIIEINNLNVKETLITTEAIEAPTKGALPCFVKMMKGSIKEHEGRDVIAFRLSVHLKKQGIPKDIALQIMGAWDNTNLPPLKEKLKEKIEQGYKNYSSYGCEDPIIKQFCDKDCPVFKKAHPEKKNIDISKFKPLSVEELNEILGISIKMDKANKTATFLCLLSAYTEDSQFGIMYNAPSSTGKSYIPMEIAKLFPKEDRMEVSYCTPTAFYHDHGEYNQELGGYFMDLERKQLIFLDQPHTDVVQRLRSFFSHDAKMISAKIADKGEKHGLKTKNIYIKGFSSVVFCTANTRINEQEATRFMLLSPETSQEKIKEALNEKAKKLCNGTMYKLNLESNVDRKLLRERIIAIKQEEINHIILPCSPEDLCRTFMKNRERHKPRYSRDIDRFSGLIKSLALLNLWFRKREGKDVIASEQDVQDALVIWDTISESQEYNLPPFIFNFFKEVILPLWHKKSKELGGSETGLSKKEIIQEHYRVYHRHLPDWQLRTEMLPMLSTSGLIYEEQDTSDKRKTMVFVSEDITPPSALDIS